MRLVGHKYSKIYNNLLQSSLKLKIQLWTMMQNNLQTCHNWHFTLLWYQSIQPPCPLPLTVQPVFLLPQAIDLVGTCLQTESQRSWACLLHSTSSLNYWWYVKWIKALCFTSSTMHALASLLFDILSPPLNHLVHWGCLLSLYSHHHHWSDHLWTPLHINFVRLILTHYSVYSCVIDCSDYPLWLPVSVYIEKYSGIDQWSHHSPVQTESMVHDLKWPNLFPEH